MTQHLYLVNPPGRKGRTNERSQSGGLGVSRKLKPFEAEKVEVLPQDFLYQAAVAERAGCKVDLVDLLLERARSPEHGLELVRTAIARTGGAEGDDACWIGVRISITSLRADVRMANLLKASFPRAKVYGFGNIIMTTLRHWVAEARFDYVFYGEPEAILEEALAAANPGDIDGVIEPATYVPPSEPGLYDPQSVALYLSWRKVTDLGNLPRAAWHLLDLRRYARGGNVHSLGVSVPASRGCFMPCTMCAYNLLEGRLMRFRTPEDVLDEIEFLSKTYGLRQIRFRDPNFSANKAHVRAIAQGIIDRGLEIESAAELSLELLDRELLELMYRAGIRTILTGIESDVPEIMRSIGQNVKITRILEGKVPLCAEIGIKLYTFFLIGSPEETWHTVKRTWTFARSLGTESTMTTMTPFPGTPIYWRALSEGLLPRGEEMIYEEWNSYTATMRTYTMSLREVRLARTWARLETYVPYSWKQLHGAPLRRRVRGLVRLAPRTVALAGLRLYAWSRLRQETKRGISVGSPASSSSPAATGHAARSQNVEVLSVVASPASSHAPADAILSTAGDRAWRSGERDGS